MACRSNHIHPRHPDRFIGFGDIRLDDADVLDQIDRFHRAGLRGLGEITSTQKNYDIGNTVLSMTVPTNSKCFFCFTGVVNRPQPDQSADISFDRMRVTRLDLIARH
jgi:uncharacterized protein